MPPENETIQSTDQSRKLSNDIQRQAEKRLINRLIETGSPKPEPPDRQQQYKNDWAEKLEMMHDGQQEEGQEPETR